PADRLESAVRNCSAMVLVHQFGIPAQCTAAVGSLETDVVEDITTVLGATSRGHRVGLVGRLAVLSTAATKLICTGEGGAIAGGSADVALCEQWTDPESRLLYEEPVPNAKLSAMACAMGRAQLKKLSNFLERRARI